MISPTYEFPENFIWGAATAPHQIEGNNTASDWWAREHSPRTDVSEPSGDAADSYNRYREDIRLLADSGLTMYRFGHRMGPHRTCGRSLLQSGAAALPGHDRCLS